MHITNIGGSLTTAVCLSLIAWSIRVLRAAKLADQKSQKNPPQGGSLPSIRSNRRTFARLSPTAFWLLVQSRSIRAILVDVRSAKEAEEAAEDDVSKRLDMISIPVEELASVLRQKNTAWRARTNTPPPALRSTIVFVSTHGHSASTAASLAMSLGFQRCAVIEGGLAAAAPLAPPIVSRGSSSGSLNAGGGGAGADGESATAATAGAGAGVGAGAGAGAGAAAAGAETAMAGEGCAATGAGAAGAAATSSNPASPTAARAVDGDSGSDPASGGGGGGGGPSPRGGSHTTMTTSPRSAVGSPRSPTASASVPPDQRLSRDAVLLLLEYGAAQGSQLATLIDVRRHDERSLYGSIRGSVHLPVEQLPKALLAPAEDWLRAFHFRKPGADDVVVVYSRSQQRANLAKQLFNDAGLHRCLVLHDGVVGWRGGGGGGEDVRAYEAYAEGEIPPEPFPGASPEPIDRPEAEAELLQKNVLLP